MSSFPESPYGGQQTVINSEVFEYNGSYKTWVVIKSSTVSGTVTNTNTSTSSSVGYLGLPQNSESSSYTLSLSDQGRQIYLTTTSTITIPDNATIAFPVGTAIAIITSSGATVTISINNDMLYMAVTGSTGDRTLSPFGMASIVKVDDSTWFISGAGLS